MIYPIVKYGDPVLDKPAAIVSVFDDELKKLVEDMFESMYGAHGVGLAAPQIGISKRIAVIDCSFKEDRNAKMVIINPEILKKEGKQTHSEGCLSLPDFRENVTRAMKCTVRAQDDILPRLRRQANRNGRSGQSELTLERFSLGWRPPDGAGSL